MRVTLRAVNVELARQGIDSFLVNAGKYFYFKGGAAAGWLDRTVPVTRVGDLTLKQWVETYRELERKNQNVLRPVNKPPVRVAAGRQKAKARS